MKAKEEPGLLTPCPVCAAEPGERCELATGQPRANIHWERLLIAEDPEMMFAVLRAELKAIVEWDRETRVLRSQTEIDAVMIRQKRRGEIARQLAEIVSTN